MNKEWSEMNKTMQLQIKKKDTFSTVFSFPCVNLKICSIIFFPSPFVFHQLCKFKLCVLSDSTEY